MEKACHSWFPYHCWAYLSALAGGKADWDFDFVRSAHLGDGGGRTDFEYGKNGRNQNILLEHWGETWFRSVFAKGFVLGVHDLAAGLIFHQTPAHAKAPWTAEAAYTVVLAMLS